MASEHLPNYLLSHRKRSALSQTEVAFLLGVQGAAKVCLHERFDLDPGLQTTLAYAAIYQKSIAELFPGLVESVQKEVRARVKLLEQKGLHSNSNAITTQKRQSLAAILSAEPNHQLKQS